MREQNDSKIAEDEHKNNDMTNESKEKDNDKDKDGADHKVVDEG